MRPDQLEMHKEVDQVESETSMRSEARSDAPKPMPDLKFALDEADGSPRYEGTTRRDGSWSEQVKAGTYKLRIATPPGLMLTGRLDQSDVTIERDTTIALVFRPVPETLDESTATLTLRRKISRQIGWQPKIIEVIAPAAGQARSYHFEYVVAEGMQATSAVLRALPTARSLGAPAELPKPDRYATTEHRVHLCSANVGQEYAGVAEIMLRARTSTILRGAVGVSLLSLVMIGLLLARWHALGANTMGAEVALLLAVPGGLSAYVARFRGHPFTSTVLVGLRSLALSSVIWCLAAATLIVVSRPTETNKEGFAALGRPFAPPFLLLGTVLAFNLASLIILVVAWRRSARPNDEEPVDESGQSL
jgi:hypothetical protein